MVSSASKISFSLSLGRLFKTGGLGAGDCFTLPERFSDFLEKIPEVHVWYFRFREEVASPEDVLGRAQSPNTSNRFGVGGEAATKTSTGLQFSALGVAKGEMLLVWLSQKYFFLLGGLPELKLPGDPEADKGRFGRLMTSSDLLPEAILTERVERASAV